MPHSQRKHGESGFYHVVAKGDGSQILFENDKDRKRYISILAESGAEYDVELHSYCLMSNHVHLLVKDKAQELSVFMKQLNESYAMYFAKRTHRVGRVFQRPFWSEPIETDAYFLSALRYIHANPEPARICRTQDYAWSSYQAYLTGSQIVKTDLALGMLGGIRQFEKFSSSGGGYAKPFKDSKLLRHHSSDELASIAVASLGRDTLGSLRSMMPKDRNPLIKLLSEKGFSAVEISCVTGLGLSSVYRALR